MGWRGSPPLATPYDACAMAPLSSTSRSSRDPGYGAGLELHSRDVPASLARRAETGRTASRWGTSAVQKHTAGRTVVVYPERSKARFPAGEPANGFGDRRRAPPPATVERIPWNRRTVALETVDLSTRGLETADELARYIREHLAGEERITRLRLQGTAPFVVDAEALQERLQDAFFALDLIDESDAFQSHEVLAWADEPTIRGACVRRLQQKLEDATDDTERQKAELALKLVVRALAGDPGR